MSTAPLPTSLYEVPIEAVNKIILDYAAIACCLSAECRTGD